MTPPVSFIWAAGKTDENNLDALLGTFRNCCEHCQIDSEGTWSLSCNLSEEEYRNIADGELEDIFRQHFPILFDLKRFHGATFRMQIYVSGDCWFRFRPSLIAMIAALGMEIDVNERKN